MASNTACPADFMEPLGIHLSSGDLSGLYAQRLIHHLQNLCTCPSAKKALGLLDQLPGDIIVSP